MIGHLGVWQGKWRESISGCDCDLQLQASSVKKKIVSFMDNTSFIEKLVHENEKRLLICNYILLGPKKK